MQLKEVIKRIYRLYVSYSGSETKIKYFRKRGMKIGKDCFLLTMAFSTEPYLIEIGDHTAISGGTTFITHDAAIRCFSGEFPGDDIFGRIRIGSNVFIGDNSTILPNTTIGDNCIVGAGSVVRGRFPDNSVILGNPAKVLTTMSVQKLIYRSNPGRMRTGKMSDIAKKPLVIKNFETLK